MKETKYTTYNYLLPRKKRELANYVRAFVGIPALVLFVLSFYIGLTEPLYFIFSAMGLFFSRRFIYVLWSYFKYENMLTCIAIDTHGVGYGDFKHNEIRWWLFMDGFFELKLEDDDWWVLRHGNGTWLYFPNGLLSEEDMEFLKEKIEMQKEQGIEDER